MKKKRVLSIISTALIGAQCLSPLSTFAAVVPETTNLYQQRFEELYADIKDPGNGYFSPDGVPYHSIETLMVEAPDHGHESTSEAASYYVWLEAMNGKFSGDFSGLSEAWRVIENYFIPTTLDQPGNAGYNPSSPATYAAEYPLPDYYPSELKFNTPVGNDPLYNELKSAYGTTDIYGMHWLIDCDNFYGYGKRGDGVSTPSYINTFQRGEQESTWETIPQPSWEDFSWGGQNGFLDLFTGDKTYSKQWRYTNAPDADARVVQAMYWAKEWAKDTGASVSTYTNKAVKMGDYLRYAMFDKYFIEIGAQAQTAGEDYSSAHYLMSWYYSWGGGLKDNWSWRIGSSHNHFGYQSPMAAWILSTDSEMKPKSTNGASDWSKSLDRQIEFYNWLQSSEGAIAGGATNSYGGAYQKYPAGTSTFYGMAYDENPVYEDPGSNTWFGMQTWSMQRMAEYYYETGDARVKTLLDKWASWAKSEVQLYDDGTFAIPSTIDWEGQPDTWNGQSTGNSNLHVSVVNYGTDLGITGSLANTLLYYAAADKKYSGGDNYVSYVDTAEELLDRMWNLYRDDKGVAVEEVRADYKRFFEQTVYVPASFSGTMANGDAITQGVTFIDIRSKYREDPDFARLQDAYNKGEDFKITYHRFWAQCDIAIANGTMAILFPERGGEEVNVPTVAITAPENNAVIDYTQAQEPITVAATATVETDAIAKVEFFADGVKIGESNALDYNVSFVPTKVGADEAGLKKIVLTAKAITDKNVTKVSEPVVIAVQFKVSAVPQVVIVEPIQGAVVDATQEAVTVPVTATAAVTDGEIATVSIFADGVKIGEAVGATCTANYVTPDRKGVANVIFTAEAITTENMTGTAEPVTITVNFPEEEVVVPTVNLNVAVNSQSGPITNTLGQQYTITTNDDSVDLSQVSIRYYFTLEGDAAQNFYCDNAAMQSNKAPWYADFSSNVIGTLVAMSTPTDTANYYLELKFNTNTPLEVGSKLQAGIRVAKSDWTNYDQSNDYSYTSGVVALYGDTVISGQLPQ